MSYRYEVEILLLCLNGFAITFKVYINRDKKKKTK